MSFEIKSITGQTTASFFRLFSMGYVTAWNGYKLELDQKTKMECFLY